jgi:hypothetical protein
MADILLFKLQTKHKSQKIFPKGNLILFIYREKRLALQTNQLSLQALYLGFPPLSYNRPSLLIKLLTGLSFTEHDN